MTCEIIWTVVPNGIRGKQAYLSLVVTPRISESGVLGDIGDFDDWPALIDLLSFSAIVAKRSSKVIPLTRYDAYGFTPQERSILWKAIFPAGMAVLPSDESTKGEVEKGFEPVIFSYPTDPLARASERLYGARVAEHIRALRIGAKPKPVDIELLSGFTFSPPNVSDQKGADGAATAAGDNTVPARTGEPLAEAIKSFELFHNPAHVTPPGAYARAAEEGYEFHTTVSKLRSYPSLTRGTALVLDFVFDAAELGEDAVDYDLIQVQYQPKDALKTCVPIAPWTKFEARTIVSGPLATFHPQRSSDLVGGFLQLASGNFGWVMHDVDGSVIKHSFHRAYLQGRRQQSEMPKGEDPPCKQPDQKELSAGRSVGINIYSKKAASQMEGALRRELSLRAMTRSKDTLSSLEGVLATEERQLTAEDLTMGYRFDMYKGHEWESLVARIVGFSLKTGEGGAWVPWPKEYLEEGFSSEEMSESQPGDRVYRLSDSLCRWDGWSLSVPRPTKTLTSSGNSSDLEDVELPEGDLQPVRVTMRAVPKSLPRLRYAESYAARCRLTDIAGNSWTLEEATMLLNGDSGSLSSTVLQLGPYTRVEPVASPILVPWELPGPGESGSHLVIRKQENGQTKAKTWYILPPRSSELFSESHGFYDELTADESWKFIVGNQLKIPDEPIDGGGAIAEYEQQLKKFKKAISDRGQRIPYIPDPLCRGVAMQDVPGTAPNETIKLTFENDWDQGKPGKMPRPVVVHLVPSKTLKRPDIANNNREITIYLPPGYSQTVYLSSHLDVSDVQRFAPWLWTKGLNLLDETEQAQGVTFAADGLIESFTPCRAVTMVHAVPQPILAPVLGVPLSDDKLPQPILRPLNTTTADVPVIIDGHRSSTGKVSISGIWHGVVDPCGTEFRPEHQDGKTPILLKDERSFQMPELSAPESLANMPEFGEIVSASASIKLPDTKYRTVTLRTAATSRYAAYYDGSANPAMQSKDSVDVEVYCSARAEAPRPAHILPLIEWKTKSSGQGITKTLERTRLGGGLRVFLHRPWVLSGRGEMLGVVLPQTMDALIGKDDRHFFSSWGMDPTFKSEPLPHRPLLDDFVNPDLVHVQCPVLETAENDDEAASRVIHTSIAAFEVKADFAQVLYYADIHVDARRSYFPFLQLSLCRYQPKSVQFAHVSRTSLAEFVQLVPERVLSLRQLKKSGVGEVELALELIVKGPVYSEAYSGQLRSEMEWYLERRQKKTPLQSDEKWQLVGPPTRLEFARLSTSQGRWYSQVASKLDTRYYDYRVVVREYEELLTDKSDIQERTTRRLVYLDTIALDYFLKG